MTSPESLPVQQFEESFPRWFLGTFAKEKALMAVTKTRLLGIKVLDTITPDVEFFTEAVCTHCLNLPEKQTYKSVAVINMHIDTDTSMGYFACHDRDHEADYMLLNDTEIGYPVAGMVLDESTMQNLIQKGAKILPEVPQELTTRGEISKFVRKTQTDPDIVSMNILVEIRNQEL